MVETIDGEHEVKIPAGAQPGEQVVLRGLGLPTLRGTARGDQHVVLDIVVPCRLDDEQRELAERLEGTLEDENLSRDGRSGTGWRSRLRRSRR
jgi:molecular chaperone DnaJ